jgi:Serine dehydrogenase proteinase
MTSPLEKDVHRDHLVTLLTELLRRAIHAERYQRQAIIKNIQERSERRLICYVSGGSCAIDRDDTVPFVDLLHNVPPREDLDLLLHTGGGDIDAAEKLISMVRNKVGTGILRIIVPDFAKSAGTLMVLGADCVVMSDTSELGPIDPQIFLADGNGNRIRHSVQSYLDAYDEHTATLKKEPGNVAAQIMLGKLDPATVKLFQAVQARARQFAEVQLKRGMFRNGGNWSQTASELLDTKRWQSHAQMISWEDAKDPPYRPERRVPRPEVRRVAGVLATVLPPTSGRSRSPKAVRVRLRFATYRRAVDVIATNRRPLGSGAGAVRVHDDTPALLLTAHRPIRPRVAIILLTPR